MMNGDDMSRGGAPMHNSRKSYPPKYPEKGYSPSTSFNYGNNFNQGQGQQSKRRFDRPKREQMAPNDKLVHQNEQIIRLLKEIRDRLPAPAVVPQNIPNASEINEISESDIKNEQNAGSFESNESADESLLVAESLEVAHEPQEELKASKEPVVP